MNKCPKCGTELEMGYGLAGGGIGAYEYCPECGEITDKWLDPEMEDDDGAGQSGGKQGS